MLCECGGYWRGDDGGGCPLVNEAAARAPARVAACGVIICMYNILTNIHADIDTYYYSYYCDDVYWYYYYNNNNHNNYYNNNYCYCDDDDDGDDDDDDYYY